MEVFDLGPTVALTVLIVAGTILLTGIVFFIRSAPPTVITISSGAEGSIFHGLAQKYATELGKNGIKVHVQTSNGSLENLDRISDPKKKVDLALIQSGSEIESSKLENLVSLGGMSFQPIFFFYRGAKADGLSKMKNKKIAIGPRGSGVRNIALKLLKLNGITEEQNLLSYEGTLASEALLKKEIDGAFLMSEDASVKVLRTLLHSDDIKLMSFRHAPAYLRKIDFLHKLELPEGVLDFENNIPDQNITLIGPMVELIAHKDLHPALSDMVLDAAMKIHSPAGLFKKRGEFPKEIEDKIKLSEDATRFYKSGKSFLYRYLPFWLASLLNRVVVVFLPMLLILIPAVRSVPAVFRWMGQLKIRRRYRALLSLESKFKSEKDPEKIKTLHEQFERIEKDVQQMKVSVICADQFYSLRVHIDYVRRLVASKSA